MPRKLTHNDYCQFLKTNFPTIITLDRYSGSTGKFRHKCTVHDLIFNTSYNNLKMQANKSRGSLCPMCVAERPKAPAKNGYVTTLVPENEALARLRSAHGARAPKLISSYTGISKKLKFQCVKCGNVQSISISLLESFKYPCSCYRAEMRIPFSTLSKHDLNFLKFLYCDLFYSVPQIHELTGVREGTVITALKNLEIYREPNGTQKLRRAADRRALASEFSGYRRQAHLMTNYVYNVYRDTLDPKSKRGRTHHLDHALSILDAYSKYTQPLSMCEVCHPANLRIITASANLGKRAKSLFSVNELRSRIKKFEARNGKVEFPEHLQLEFVRNRVDSNDSGLRVLAFDPGTANFGVFGGTLYGASRLTHLRAQVSVMLSNTVKSLGEDLWPQLQAFRAEVYELINRVRPHVIVIERFQSRGLKGNTSELVNLMIGVVASVLTDIEEQTGMSIKLKLLMASQWKNALNKCFDINELYAQMPQSQRHRLDAMLMGLSAFPGESAYRALTKKHRDGFVNFILRKRLSKE